MMDLLYGYNDTKRPSPNMAPRKGLSQPRAPNKIVIRLEGVNKQKSKTVRGVTTSEKNLFESPYRQQMI